MFSMIIFIFLFSTCLSSTYPPLGYSCQKASGKQCKKRPFVPGHNLLGEGLNIVTMKTTRAFLIDLQGFFGPDKKCTLCNNPHKDMTLQKLPFGVTDWRPLSKCSTKITSKVSRSTMSMAQESSSSVQNDWETGLQLDHGPASGKVVLAGSQSELTQFTHGKSNNDRYSFTSQQLSCSYYSFRLEHEPPLTNHFKNALKMLPTSYNRTTKSKYHNLIQTYGTHYISQAEVGGQALEVTAIRTCRIAMDGMSMDELKDCLSMEASAAVTGKAEANAKSNSCKELSQKVTKGDSFHQTFNERSWQVKGGKITFELLSFDGKNGGNPSAFEAWMESLKTDPDMLTYSLEPIHNLVRFKGPQKENLRKAINEYIMEKALRKNCTCPGSSQLSEGAECSCICQVNQERNQNCCPTKRGFAKLVVTIQHAQGLWGDYISKTDAYIKVSFGNVETGTSTIWNNNNPKWNSRLDMGVVDLNSVSELVVKIWDEDNKYDDDLLGSCKKQVISGKTSEVCYPQHGRLDYTLSVTCVPHLSGPKCQEYAPSKE
ncbi:perforin-1-like [Discoglossus pictus]